MIKLADILKEIGWKPNTEYQESYIVDKDQLMDGSVIAQFVEYQGLPKIINDIWKYAKVNYNLYPTKITTGGMVYYPKNRTKIEIEFTKDGANLYQFKDNDNLMMHSKFNFKTFNQMMS
jgi:hypothetical protein